ncbi:hypothetical protein K466DRAFT_99186 [Polyporus arcularius HHB13444]|uniref:F-box domain-containing protein n=1 Tax=Polyporus arcularius HHB13444 TaxID=1314778 RepID=A0A5C3PEN1_9APHY|nr:hypothetical protein K466DRAFT_99186 [Polyporus arcularius HHB13444]
MDLNHDTIEEDWLRSPNLAPARVQELASEMLRADEARMTALHARMLRVKRIHNSAALINARLPLEILVEVFRLAGPLTGSKDAIRLTHVCHAWRTLIHDTPAFWTDFVFPPPGHLLVGSTRRNHPSVVLDALARTAPMRITFGLCGDYLPVLNTPAAESHLSRISALYLDCTGGGDGDMRPFFDLSLLSLESLELRVKCDASLLPADIAAESPARFPRLRILRTTCTGFPLAWVGPSLKILDVLAGLEEAVTPRQARRVRCCYRGSLSELFLVLERCPGLEVLGFFGCLPHDPVPIAQSTSPRLDHLETVRIWDDADCIRMFLERITDTFKRRVGSREHGSPCFPPTNPSCTRPQMWTSSASSEDVRPSFRPLPSSTWT